MRGTPPKGHPERWLLTLMSLAVCFTLAGCRTPAGSDKNTEPRESPAAKFSRWMDSLRDDRAMEVERHMNEK